MALWDIFGTQKRKQEQIEELKALLKQDIEEKINTSSQAYLSDWEERQKTVGRAHKVSYATLQQLYTKESWVRACIDAIQRASISNGFRLVPTNEEEELKEDGRLKPIFSLLEAPNSEDTFADIISEIIIDLHIYGDAYVEIAKNKQGIPIALFNVNVPSMKILVDKHGKILGYIQLPQGVRTQNPVIFSPDEIIHFKFPNPGNEVYGLSPLESLFIPIETDLLAQSYNKKFFENHATPKLHVDLGNCTLQQLKRTRMYFSKELQGVRNAHKTLVTEGGAKINVIGTKPSDMEFLNQRKFSRDEICSVLGVPPIKIGISEDVNRASAGEHDKTFKSEKVIPLQRMIATKLNLRLISLFKLDVKFEFVEVDLRDAKEQAEIDEIYVRNGIVTINELRKKRGLPPLEEITNDEPDNTSPQEP